MVESPRGSSRWVLLWLGWTLAVVLLAPLLATDRPLLFHGRDDTRGLAAWESLRQLERAGDFAGMDASLRILAEESAEAEPFLEAARQAPAARAAGVASLLETQPLWRAPVRWRSPALETLGAAERGLLLLVPLLLALPWLRRRRLPALGSVTLLVAAGLFWPSRSFAPAGEFKLALHEGRAQAEWLVWAAIPYSPLELKPAEAWAAPFGMPRTRAEGGLVATRSEVQALPGEAAPGSRARHWLGTDALGRDVLARLWHGARTSLVVGLFAALLASALGALIGAGVGWVGGWWDALFLRAVEVLACLPGLLVVLLVMSLVPVGSAGSLVWLVAVLVLFGWTHPARLVRAQALRVRELDYLRVAEGLGKSRLWILREHILPNAIDPALVGVGFLAASAILLESTVSFLGVGVSEPTPSLGALVASAIGSSWSVLFTGLALVALVLPWHALSEDLRRRLQQGDSAA